MTIQTHTSRTDQLPTLERSPERLAHSQQCLKTIWGIERSLQRANSQDREDLFHTALVESPDLLALSRVDGNVAAAISNSRPEHAQTELRSVCPLPVNPHHLREFYRSVDRNQKKLQRAAPRTFQLKDTDRPAAAWGRIEPDPLTQLITAEEERLAWEALRVLPRRQLRCLLEHYVRDLTEERIGREIVHRAKSVVSNDIKRALAAAAVYVADSPETERCTEDSPGR